MNVELRFDRERLDSLVKSNFHSVMIDDLDSVDSEGLGGDPRVLSVYSNRGRLAIEDRMISSIRTGLGAPEVRH